jgi:hypothetical protein
MVTFNEDTDKAREDTRKTDRPRFEIAQEFTDPKSGITVQVSKMTGTRFPRLSFQIGRKRDDGSIATHIQWRQNLESTTFELETNVSGIIAFLLQQAQDYATMEMQLAYHYEQDRIAQRDEERSRATQGSKAPRVTGKTARQKAKKAGKA